MLIRLSPLKVNVYPSLPRVIGSFTEDGGVTEPFLRVSYTLLPRSEPSVQRSGKDKEDRESERGREKGGGEKNSVPE